MRATDSLLFAPEGAPLRQRSFYDLASDRVTGSLSESAGREAAGEPIDPHRIDSHRVERVDAVELLRRLPSASVDLMVTDPAYESLEKHRAIGTTTRLKHSKSSSNDWFTIFPNARFPELFREAYRVLKKNTHLYLFCDQETMFVAKPIGEEAGFKFWKPIVWDKCLAPETPVWTGRGVIPIGDIQVGDRVATPSGGIVAVLARRKTHAPAVRVALSDGSTVTASVDHRFQLRAGGLVEAGQLSPGDQLETANVRPSSWPEGLRLDEIIAADDLIYELPDTTNCLWCGQGFESTRAAAAHQARFCSQARSKASMAENLGVSAKRLRRWMSDGRIPASWAAALGLEPQLTKRVRMYLQNDAEQWYPETLPLDYGLGKLVGLYAAEGSHDGVGGVCFALHAQEKHLQNHIARTVRALGARAQVEIVDNRCIVRVGFKIVGQLIRRFVGGRDSESKHFLETVYRAPAEFRRGVLDGLLEGDGSWSHDEQRETLNTTSHDLALFVHRQARDLGFHSTIRRFENDTCGGWRVRFDPAAVARPLTVVSVEPAGSTALVDIAIDDPDQLFVLGNGLVTHNCQIGMGYHYRSRYEMILFFEKGKRKLKSLSIPDILEAPRIRGGYPSEKPARVSEILIGQSSEPGELVVDPFCGSGSVGVAARSLERRFLGSDVCEEAVDITRDRLSSISPSSEPNRT